MNTYEVEDMALKTVDLRENEKKRAAALKAATASNPKMGAIAKARKAGIVRAADRK